MINIGIKIKQYRSILQMSQYELEAITGIEHSRISRIENGLIIPDIEELFALSKALDVDICDLIPCGYSVNERKFLKSFRKLMKEYIRQYSSF